MGCQKGVPMTAYLARTIGDHDIVGFFIADGRKTSSLPSMTAPTRAVANT
jgi:hypothetical protein